MSSRRASDAGSVLSFTFLDVLMCTMGSLLLMLVVFGVIVKKATRARRDGEDVKVSLEVLKLPDAPKQGSLEPPTPAPAPAVAEAAEGVAEEMAKQLSQLRSEQAEIERLRGEAAQRRLEEQDRIAHLEDHERRLEHELAQLHVTLEVLQQTEQKQDVDQDQAEAEVKRLKELIADTEARLDAMRKNGGGEKSYAIVPYKGANGTFRRPVFVECTADAVTIQPEGIRLTVEDFDGPLRSGNPLAAAIRAAHEELNARAVAAGRTDLPDPYPLLIVRPDGSAAYAAALDAIRSWDSDYGYEFVEADWKLTYPEVDPRLSQIMAHAVDEARQRQALLAKVAPREYAPRLVGGGAGGPGGGLSDGDGGGFGELTSTGSGNRIGSHAGDGAFGNGRYAGGNSLRGGTGLSAGAGGAGAGGNFSDEFAGSDASAGGQGGAGLVPGGGSGVGGPGAGMGAGGTGGPGSTAVGQGAAGAQGDGNSRYATAGTNGQLGGAGQTNQNMAGASSANGSATGAAGGNAAGGQAGGENQGAAGADAGAMAGGSASGSAAGGASGGGASGGGSSGGGQPGGSSGSGSMGGIPPVQVGPKRGSVADSRGANWANAEASRRTSAITRPVRVVINAEQLTVMTEGGSPSDATSVSFKQPVERVVDQLAGAVQMQVVDWGLAGDGMYWRPTLVVTIAPGAERQAQRLAELLDNSGLDVRLPQATANASQTEQR